MNPDYRGHGKPVQQGCICPPTSEQTCQNQLCPRKALPTPFPPPHSNSAMRDAHKNGLPARAALEQTP